MSEYCGGCPYHEFPYDAQLPFLVDGVRKKKKFKSKEDIWDVIYVLIQEVNDVNKEGKEFDIAESINSQLPFFSCRNMLYDKSIQKDIERYIYCKELNVQPYQGSYGEQPALWVQRSVLIIKGFAKLEKLQVRKAKKNAKRK